MKEKKKSAVSWILTWAGQKRSAYVWSVVLAVGNVIFKIIPYFIIANVVTMFLDGSKEFKEYLKPNSIKKSLQGKKRSVEEYDRVHLRNEVKKDKGIAI